MKQDPIPYKKTLFVCTHTRPDESGRVACGNPGRGGLELCSNLKESVKKAGLGKTVRVVRSGCLDLCEQGPNAFLYPQGEWLSGLHPEDIATLLDRASTK